MYSASVWLYNPQCKQDHVIFIFSLPQILKYTSSSEEGLVLSVI